jgi:hypothetical protein
MWRQLPRFDGKCVEGEKPDCNLASPVSSSPLPLGRFQIFLSLSPRTPRYGEFLLITGILSPFIGCAHHVEGSQSVERT